MVRFGLSLHDDDDAELDDDELGGGDDDDDDDDGMLMLDDDDAMPTLLEASAEDAEMADSARGAPEPTTARGARGAATPAGRARVGDVGLTRSAVRMRSATPLEPFGEARAEALLAPSPLVRAAAEAQAASSSAAVEMLLAMAARRPALVPALVQPCRPADAPAGAQLSLCARLLQESGDSNARGGGGRRTAAGTREYPLRMFGLTSALAWAPDGSLLLSCVGQRGPSRGRPAVLVLPQSAWHTADGARNLDAAAAAADAAPHGALLTAARGAGAPDEGWRTIRLQRLILHGHRAHVACAPPADFPGAADSMPARLGALCAAYVDLEREAAQAAADAVGAPFAELGGGVPAASRGEQLWLLVDALWGERGACSVRSEESVARWLRALAADAADVAIAAEAAAHERVEPLDAAFHHLAALEVGRAARVVRAAGYPRLAVLVALAGSTAAGARGARRQLEQWEAVGALEHVPAGVARIYRLLAGQVLHAQTRAAELAWPQALCLCWWLMRGDGRGGEGGAADEEHQAGGDAVPNRLLASALGRYRAAFEARLLRAPHAAHRLGAVALGERDDGHGNAEAAGARDCLWHLLTLATDAAHALPALASCYTLGAHPLQPASAWHLHETLWRIVGARPLPLSCWRQLRNAAAAELLARGEWEAAAYVCAQAPPPGAERERAREAAAALAIVRRNAGAEAVAATAALAGGCGGGECDGGEAADGPDAGALLAAIAAGDGGAADAALGPRARECVALFEGLSAASTVLSAADVQRCAHEAAAEAAGVACAHRAQLAHLLAARQWARAHALATAQLAPRVLLSLLLRPTDGGAALARAELEGVLDCLARHQAEVRPPPFIKHTPPSS
ncbi:hypothetical protein T492DRAFT_1141439 [Pavlovales sp. CCMP2436]|nr:hypothetical protein T492DRAFT_1141439 [Pavlovales sp. CCMP2436]